MKNIKFSNIYTTSNVYPILRFQQSQKNLNISRNETGLWISGPRDEIFLMVFHSGESCCNGFIETILPSTFG